MYGLGDPLGQAGCHLSICLLFDGQGDPVSSLRHARSALRLFRTAGHLAGQAFALNAVGWSTAVLGRIRPGLRYCQQALKLHRQTGHRFGEASTLDSIGYCCLLLGEPDQAIIHYELAIGAYMDASDRYYLAHTLDRLGDARRAVGSDEDAHEAWRQAIDILDVMRHPDAGILRAKLIAGAVP